MRLVISTNVPFAEGVTRVGVYSARGAGVEEASAQALQDTWGSDGQVGNITVVPSGGDEAPVYVRVVMGIGRDPDGCRLSATQKDGCIVARRKVSFISGQSLDVPVRLHLACNGVLCSADTTCNSVGSCVSSSIDSSRCGEPGGCEVSGDGAFLPVRDAGTDGSLLVDATSDTGGTLNDAGSDAAADGAAEAGTDAGSEAGTDAGSDAGTDAGSGSDGGAPGFYSPCNNTVGVDPLAAWPVIGGCANRANSSKLAGPHAQPGVRSLGLSGAQGRIVAGRVTNGILRAFVSHTNGVHAIDIPLAGGAITNPWSKSLGVGTHYLGLGTDGTLYVSGSTANALDPVTGDPVVGWTVRAVTSATDLLPAPSGPGFVQAGGNTIERIGPLTREWFYTEPNSTASNVAYFANGEIAWAAIAAGQRFGYRFRPADGSQVWSKSSATAFASNATLMTTDTKVIQPAAAGGPMYIQAFDATTGNISWGTSSGASGFFASAAQHNDGTQLFVFEGNISIARYALADGARTQLTPQGSIPSFLVTDKDGWLYRLDLSSGALTAYAPPHTAASWVQASNSNCGAPALAAGMILAACQGMVYAFGP